MKIKGERCTVFAESNGEGETKEANERKDRREESCQVGRQERGLESKFHNLYYHGSFTLSRIIFIVSNSNETKRNSRTRNGKEKKRGE